MFVKHRTRLHRTHVAAAAWLLLFSAGCGDVDWNWDLSWWEKPKRVVRPIRPQTQPDRQRAAQSTTAPAADQPSVATARPQAQPTPARSAADHTQASNLPPMNPRLNDPVRAGLPFYQLYLANNDHPREEQPGERHLTLNNANARACASLIEILYVPMGRSGSANECYLIYENQSEFDAAISFVPMLDVAALGEPATPVGATAAWNTGVSQTLWILAQGAAVNTLLVDDCERHLVEALQSTQLPSPNRWAAGIVAGRLASEFKYDYASAKSYYRQAEQATGDGSPERMTARWWFADALLQEGKTAEARDVYQTIVNEFGEWQKCQIVRRSQAKLEERRKR